MMKKVISDKEFIRKYCKVECKWDNATNKWIVRINHITNDIAYSGVKVTMDGFDNFREACDEAVKLFQRNIRNNIKDLQTVKVSLTEDDVWPEYINA